MICVVCGHTGARLLRDEGRFHISCYEHRVCECGGELVAGNVDDYKYTDGDRRMLSLDPLLAVRGCVVCDKGIGTYRWTDSGPWSLPVERAP